MVESVERFGGCWGVSGFLRLRLSHEAARAFAQDDRLVGEWAGSRFLASTPTGKERLSGTPAFARNDRKKGNGNGEKQVPRFARNGKPERQEQKQVFRCAQNVKTKRQMQQGGYENWPESMGIGRKLEGDFPFTVDS